MISSNGTVSCGKSEGRVCSLESHGGVGDRAGIEILSVDHRDSSGQIHFLLCAISDHDNIVKKVLVIREADREVSLCSIDIDFPFGESDIRHHESRRIVYAGQFKVSVHISKEACLGALHHE